MENNKYQGWTNYETWRVMLEMFDGYEMDVEEDTDAYDLGVGLKEEAEDIISMNCNGLGLDYALSFLNKVNWREIAEAVIECNNDIDNEIKEE